MPDVIKELQDKTYLYWSVFKSSPGTPGTFLKAEEGTGEKKVYYKLSQFDSMNGIVGHECINEIIVSRLLDILSINHLDYQLQHAKIIIEEKEYETWICASRNFRKPYESKVTLENLYGKYHFPQESVMEFCQRYKLEDYICEMLTVDYLIFNRDRHGANIEIIMDNKTGDIHPAPLFDHGLSLLFSCQDEESLVSFDMLKDGPANNYIGSRSTYDNLSLIPPEKLLKIKKLTKKDEEYLIHDLEQAINPLWLERIVRMINERMKQYEVFYHQRHG